MALEAFLMFISQYFTLVAPWEDLKYGHATERALSINYENKPPYFSILRAIIERHVLLALVASMNLLSQVLAIAVSGLFQKAIVVPNGGAEAEFLPIKEEVMDLLKLEDYFNAQFLKNNRTNHEYYLETWSSTSSKLYPTLDPNIKDFFKPYKFDSNRVGIGHTSNSNLNMEAIYAALGSSGHSKSLPPWTTHDYYFRPYKITERALNRLGHGSLENFKYYKVKTYGYGSDITCTPYKQKDDSQADIFVLPEYVNPSTVKDHARE